LIVPNENDSIEELQEIAKFISGIDKTIPWHISRFFPMYQMNDREKTSLDVLKNAEKIGKKYLNHVYLGNVW
jgi:pyruvate formate lyase activating enzyme